MTKDNLIIAVLLLFFLFLLIIVATILRAISDNEKERKEIWETLQQNKKQALKRQKEIIRLFEEHEKNPILCAVCTKKNRKKTYFKGLTSFHCPRCDHHGFPSMYKNICTKCSNAERFGFF